MRAMRRSSRSRSMGSDGGRSRIVPSSSGSSTPVKTCTRFTLAPAASRRGRMVSASPSSAESNTTSLGRSGRSRSGIGEAVEMRAARSSANVDLPSPGSPSSVTNFPAGNRPAHSHSTRSDFTAAMVVNLARSSSSAWSPWSVPAASAFSSTSVTATRSLTSWPPAR